MPFQPNTRAIPTKHRRSNSPYIHVYKINAHWAQIARTAAASRAGAAARDAGTARTVAADERAAAAVPAGDPGLAVAFLE